MKFVLNRKASYVQAELRHHERCPSYMPPRNYHSTAISSRVEGSTGVVVSPSDVSLTSSPDLFTILLTLPSAMARFDMAIHNPPNREALANPGPDEVVGTNVEGSDLHIMPRFARPGSSVCSIWARPVCL